MKKNDFKLLYKIALFFISPLLFASLSCNDNPTTHDDIKPGRRDYTWTVGELNLSFTHYESFSLSDIGNGYAFSGLNCDFEYHRELRHDN